MSETSLTLLAEQSTLNYLGFDGLLSEAEVLELGAGLTLAGDGLVYAYDANDTIRLLGTVEGVAGGRLELNDLDNAGAAFAVDASEGQVVLGDRIRAVRIEAADGQTGAIGIESSTDLEDVALAIDARLSGSGSTTAYVQGGLTLDDATLSVEASENRTVTLEFEGTQTLDGEGTVLLSAAGAPEGASVTNQLAFDGLSSAAETLVIGEDITLAGHGLVYAYDSGDTIRLRGTAQGTSDGTLVLSDEVDLTSAGFELGQGLVQVRNDLVLGADNNVSLQLVSNEEGDASLDVKGTLTQGGTLSLVIAETFDAEIGDTFEFATAESVGGAFDSFSGFDLDGDRALALRQDSNRLFLEVVTDDEASQFITDDVMLS